MTPPTATTSFGRAVLERAERYHSEAYTAALQLREDAGRLRHYVVDGVN